MSGSPKEVLNRARAAFSAENYSEALAQYEYFFDHALDGDEHSFYGVRLSYCLDEWANLGQKYPAALVRLGEKRDEALSLFTQTGNPERFHDFESICQYLKCENLPVEQFLIYHASHPELAKSTFRFIRDSLVKLEHWDVCATYIVNPHAEYKSYLDGLDMMLRHHRKEGWEDDFPKEWYVEKVSDLLLVLKNTGKNNETVSLQNLIAADMQSRGLAELAKDISQRARL